MAAIYGGSEIRLGRPRHIGVLSRVPLDVFGASLFRPLRGGVRSAGSIRHGRGPWRREDVLILDRELELQVLTPRVRIPHPVGDVILLCVSFEPVFRGFSIK